MPHDAMTEIVDTLAELKRMHQLNLELLEQFAVTCDWLFKNHIQIPNVSSFVSLLNKATTLLTEMQADEPVLIQYQKLSRRKVTPFRDDEEVTEPIVPLYKGGIVFSEH